MPRETEQDWKHIAGRIDQHPRRPGAVPRGTGRGRLPEPAAVGPADRGRPPQQAEQYASDDSSSRQLAADPPRRMPCGRLRTASDAARAAYRDIARSTCARTFARWPGVGRVRSRLPAAPASFLGRAPPDPARSTTGPCRSCWSWTAGSAPWPSSQAPSRPSRRPWPP
ncbi:hypothetical protein QJS66_07500 [Kocuria rhizophila]|nr:hypothetical protein QJS66_07500 [Kocuria rhizophila]